MEYTEIRDIIQNEYDKKTTDTNFNFISRFAKAVYEAQEVAKNLYKPLVSGSVCENCKILQKEIDDLQSQCNAWEYGRP